MSVGRFPFEKGLEHQMVRFFKEMVASPEGLPLPKGDLFALCADEALQHVLRDFKPQLWEVFKENAAGEGAYGPPHWASTGFVTDIVDVPAQQNQDASLQVDTASQQPTSHAEVGHAGLGLPESTGYTSRVPHRTQVDRRVMRRGFGGQQRRVHLQARADTTVRVKDLLNLLHKMGLLQPLSECPENLLTQAMEAPKMAIFPAGRRTVSAQLEESLDGGFAGAFDNHPATMEEKPTTKETQRTLGSGGPGGATIDRFKRVMNRGLALGAFRAAGSVASAAAPSTGAAEEGASAEALPSVGAALASLVGGRQQEGPDETRAVSPSLSASSGHGGILGTGQVTDEAPGELSETEIAAEEMMQCNFQSPLLLLLRILLEVCLPQHASQLQWQLSGEESERQECVALLDYIETELTFTEFERMLLRIVECTSESEGLDVATPVNRRLEAFLKLVFLPALAEPYKPPPTPEEPGPPEGAAAAEPEPPRQPTPPPPEPEPSPKKEAEKKGKKGGGTKEQQQQPSKLPVVVPQELPPLIEPPPRIPSYWLGFNIGDLDTAAAAAPRYWPPGFVSEVADW